jgi:hypothetical protein
VFVARNVELLVAIYRATYTIVMNHFIMQNITQTYMVTNRKLEVIFDKFNLASIRTAGSDFKKIITNPTPLQI